MLLSRACIQMLMCMNGNQFADPHMFALRVACILRFFDVLTLRLSRCFAETLEVVMEERVHEIMLVDEAEVAALPGFHTPESTHWKSLATQASTREFADYVAGQNLPRARSFQQVQGLFEASTDNILHTNVCVKYVQNSFN